MFRNVVSVVLWAAAFGLCAGNIAQARDIGPPAEMPPAGYKGQQYVDSRGCVFLRAGLGGQVTWVPRVGQDRKAMCGLPPTFGPRPTIEVAEDNTAPAATATETATATVAAAAPAATVVPATTTTRVATAAPVRAATTPVRSTARVPVESYVPATVADTRVRPVITAVAPTVRATAPVVVPTVTMASTAGSGCPADAPVAQRLPLTNGGTVLVCTRGDGSMTGARNPKIWGPVGAAITGGPAEGRYAGRSAPPPPTVMPSPRYAEPTYDTAVAPRAAAAAVTVPPGYKAAWEDDRLNPLRGIGTDAGWAAQDQVWATTQPMMLVEDRGAGKRNRGTRATARLAEPVAQPVYAQPQYFVEPAAAAPRAATGGALYVQVGSFGDPNNAQNTLGRLASLGLPTARQSANSLTVVLAGPFGSSADAQAALGMARSIGFGDAFIR